MYAGLQTDKVPFELQTDGLDFWEYLKRKPQQEAQFSAAMTAADVTGAAAERATPSLSLTQRHHPNGPCGLKSAKLS